jgi:hypothetical protein
VDAKLDELIADTCAFYGVELKGHPEFQDMLDGNPRLGVHIVRKFMMGMRRTKMSIGISLRRVRREADLTQCASLASANDQSSIWGGGNGEDARE